MKRFCDDILPYLTLVAMTAAIALVFLYVPTDAAQGIVQRIFYFHVPLAMMTYASVGAVALGSAWYLWKRSATGDRIAHAGAELALLFCTLVLTTGPIWARPIWGTWWTWDARLTSTLILWLIFAAYLMLRSVSAGEQGARYAAVLGLVGAIDVPIINRSVYWWRTIHPAVIRTREGGSGLGDPRMQLTFAVCIVAFTLLFAWLLWVRHNHLRVHQEFEQLRNEALT
ncbi:MAG TPA: cytochrome c biogenesis protein CcsA [Terriglobales bacterium]|nr:cytochrome c biogenesis protein CcsA [Terriglobales bacterium]